MTPSTQSAKARVLAKYPTAGCCREAYSFTVWSEIPPKPFNTNSKVLSTADSEEEAWEFAACNTVLERLSAAPEPQSAGVNYRLVPSDVLTPAEARSYGLGVPRDAVSVAFHGFTRHDLPQPKHCPNCELGDPPESTHVLGTVEHPEDGAMYEAPTAPKRPDLERLRKLADDATGGPWKFMPKHLDSDPDAHVRRVDGEYADPDLDDGGEIVTDWCCNLEYIAAASPDVILALIDYTFSLERRLEEWK